MPGLAEMTSIFQPGATQDSNALAEGQGLENLTNDGSTLNLDDNPILSNALAEASPYDGLAQNGDGLENITNQGSLLNIDEEPTETNGLANGVGLEALTAADSELDIDTNPTNSNGLNQSVLSDSFATLSNLDLERVNDMSDGLASGNI
tara:strand:- start:156 stop:602 length:447 start_codon:yes stop_codon:yes gene_type:complete